MANRIGGVRLVEREGATLPVFVCDACGQQIEDSTQGLYVWSRADSESLRGGASVEPLFVHKGVCDDALGKETYGSSITLSALPLFLGINSGLVDRNAWDGAHRTAAILGGYEPHEIPPPWERKADQ